MNFFLLLSYQIVILLIIVSTCDALNVVIAGGSGKVGRELATLLHNDHQVTILCRNVFLASTPSRVSKDFGWLGDSYLSKHKSIKLRDWDGGDLNDIVGKDWMFWQDDVLPSADMIINLVGTYTEQRTMSVERLIRESSRLCPNVKHILVSLADEDLKMTIKKKRAADCEKMLRDNCPNSICLRGELNNVNDICKRIVKEINAD
jgi:NAD(P)-dependent dehydrogenase (short-subunit alcohol dehydrogenase family)